MIKQLFLISILFLPAAFAWNQEECEAVNWQHPDCSWGNHTVPSPPSSDSSSDHSARVSFGGGGHSHSRGAWVFDYYISPCNYYTYALVFVATEYPGVPRIVEFSDRTKKVCSD